MAKKPKPKLELEEEQVVSCTYPVETHSVFDDLPVFIQQLYKDNAVNQHDANYLVDKLDNYKDDRHGLIDHGFIWSETKQGQDFWSNIANGEYTITTCIYNVFDDLLDKPSRSRINETLLSHGIDTKSVTLSEYHEIDFSLITDDPIAFLKFDIDEMIEQSSKLKIKQVKQTIIEMKDPKFQEVKSQMSERFSFVDDVVGLLWTAYQTNEHCVMFGPGGHGKSEMSIEFFEALGIKPFVQALGPGTTVEQLLGGMNMQLFNTTGKIEYLVEHSFMNHEYVIFEEAFDAPVYVLTQLKDILTSKCLRNGDQVHPISCKMIVINTNHSRTVIAEDLSIKALMERFPLELKVEWNAYHEVNYMTMFNTLFGTSKEVTNYNVIAKLCGTLYSEGTTISPRTAVKMAKVYSAIGSNGLRYFADIPKSAFEELSKLEEQTRLDNESRNLIEGFQLDIANLLKLADECVDPTTLLKYQKKLKTLRAQMDKLVVTESYYDERTNIMNICDKAIEICATKAVEVTQIVDEEDQK